MSATEEHMENYCRFNRGALILLGACLAWPFVALLLMWIFPDGVQTCGSIRWFNKPCPMCGLTRGFLQFLRGDFAGATGFNPLTVPLSIFLFVEIVARSVLSIRSIAHALPESVPELDRLLHIGLACAYVIYALRFYAVAW